MNDNQPIENNEYRYINACLRQVEAQLNWGSSAQWTNYDFQKLGDLVLQATEVHLSISTLKRLWGKVSYKNTPSLTTLNTLARFLGYDDWRVYKQQNPLPVAEPLPQQAPQQEKATHQETTQPAKRTISPLFYGITAGLLILLLIGFATFLPAGKKFTVDPAAFNFSANKMVTEGVPNSVVFTYDATAAQTDSVYIVQTWDIRRKTLVPKNKHSHSAIYYYPGFFRTRLIADGQVVKSHNLMITSNGWLCLAEKERVPLYFKKEDYLYTDRIEINEKTLQGYNLSLQPEAPRIRFFNQRDLGSLQNDNFIFETKLKNNFTQGSGACQYVQVLIQCKDDIIIIPLAAKTCIGELTLYAAGKEVKSVDEDLSKFGCDLTQWTTLRVETVNKLMKFFVNGVEAFSFTFPHDPTGIVGLQYRFAGVGAVKDTWFSNKDGVYDFGPGAYSFREPNAATAH